MKTGSQPFPGVSHYAFGVGFYLSSFKLFRIKF